MVEQVLTVDLQSADRLFAFMAAAERAELAMPPGSVSVVEHEDDPYLVRVAGVAELGRDAVANIVALVALVVVERPELHSLAEDVAVLATTFKWQRRQWDTKRGATDQCSQAVGYLGDELPGVRWAWVGGRGRPRHVIARLPSGRFVDLTARQFGERSAYPQWYSDIDDLKREWPTVEVE